MVFLEDYHIVSLLAYKPNTDVGGGKKSIAGHASVSIDRKGVWGFYPSAQGKLITKQGILKYADEYPRTQEYADFIVDAQIMSQIREVIAEWETNPPAYVILFNDCVNFLYRICDSIGLRYNSLALLPIDAIREIRRLNDQNRIYQN
jgi:hypothetical protein